jgi:hypothetical protein
VCSLHSAHTNLTVKYAPSHTSLPPVITTVADKYVVTGGADGAVRFFDFQFRVVGWFEDIQQGAVTSVSFAENMGKPATGGGGGGGGGGDSDVNNSGGDVAATFHVPDFVVATDKVRTVIFSPASFFTLRLSSLSFLLRRVFLPCLFSYAVSLFSRARLCRCY